MSLCECGCGQPTTLARVNCRAKGYVKGQPYRFRPSHHMRSGHCYARVGAGSAHRSHRAKAERALGRPLPRGVEVHHVDADIANPDARLVICESHAYHKLLERRARVVKAGGNPNTQRMCWKCRKPVDISDFYERKSPRRVESHSSACKPCMRALANHAALTRRREKAS
jgi:hypothetical protein